MFLSSSSTYMPKTPPPVCQCFAEKILTQAHFHQIQLEVWPCVHSKISSLAQPILILFGSPERRWFEDYGSALNFAPSSVLPGDTVVQSWNCGFVGQPKMYIMVHISTESWRICKTFGMLLQFVHSCNFYVWSVLLVTREKVDFCSPTHSKTGFSRIFTVFRDFREIFPYKPMPRIFCRVSYRLLRTG